MSTLNFKGIDKIKEIFDFKGIVKFKVIIDLNEISNSKVITCLKLFFETLCNLMMYTVFIFPIKIEIDASNCNSFDTVVYQYKEDDFRFLFDLKLLNIIDTHKHSSLEKLPI